MASSFTCLSTCGSRGNTILTKLDLLLLLTCVVVVKQTNKKKKLHGNHWKGAEFLSRFTLSRLCALGSEWQESWRVWVIFPLTVKRLKRKRLHNDHAAQTKAKTCNSQQHSWNLKTLLLFLFVRISNYLNPPSTTHLLSLSIILQSHACLTLI